MSRTLLIILIAFASIGCMESDPWRAKEMSTKRSPPDSPAGRRIARRTDAAREVANLMRQQQWQMAVDRIRHHQIEHRSFGHRELGTALERLGRREEAADAYRVLTIEKEGWSSSHERDAAFLYHYLKLCRSLGRQEEVRRVTQRIIDYGWQDQSGSMPLIPRTEGSQSEMLARALLIASIELGLQNDYVESLRATQDAVQLSPQSGVAHYYLGFNFHRTGRYDQAKLAFSRARALAPSDQVIRRNIEDIQSQFYTLYD